MAKNYRAADPFNIFMARLAYKMIFNALLSDEMSLRGKSRPQVNPAGNEDILASLLTLPQY